MIYSYDKNNKTYPLLCVYLKKNDENESIFLYGRKKIIALNSCKQSFDKKRVTVS